MVRLRVREVAEAHGIVDATKLARKAGLAYATARKLWNGEVGGKDERSVGILTLHRVARALGVRMSELYDEDGRTLAVATS